MSVLRPRLMAFTSSTRDTVLGPVSRMDVLLRLWLNGRESGDPLSEQGRHGLAELVTRGKGDLALCHLVG